MMKFALGSFKDQLKLESEAILLGKVEIRDIPQGFRIMEEDSLKDAALVLVISGCFSVSQKNEEGREQELHLCYAGGLLGQLQVRAVNELSQFCTGPGEDTVAFLFIVENAH